MTRESARATHGDADAVHDARVAARRLREALALVAGRSHHDAVVLRGAARRLRRSLGAVREADVLLNLLDERAHARRWRVSAVARVRSTLLARRRKAIKAVHHAVVTINLTHLVARGAFIASAISRAPHEHASMRTLRERTRDRAQGLTDALARAGALYVPERFHEARIAVKKLRYVLELTWELAGLGRPADVNALRRAQDTLGRLHDLQDLQSAVDAVAAEVPDDGIVRRALVTISTSIADECRRIHADFLPTEPGLASVATRAGASGLAGPERAGKV